MKKTSIIAATFALLILAGCQETDKLQQDATKALDDASKQVENVKTSLMETKAKVDEKVTQAQEAADAIKKLSE